jgi:hypothetical protein
MTAVALCPERESGTGQFAHALPTVPGQAECASALRFMP